MNFKKIFVLTDNYELYNKFILLLDELNINSKNFNFFCSPQNTIMQKVNKFTSFDMKNNYKAILDENYDLVFSLHCKQLFPKELIDLVLCINIHPGFNPINRGWFPQVFSIIENTKIGATIHLIDESLDHGHIIDRGEVKSEIWDTSESLYNKVQEMEVELLRNNLINILENKFTTFAMENEGKVHLKKDFNNLKKIDLNCEGKFIEFYNHLRAMTHGDYKNCFFIDPETDKKIFISLNITKNDE